MDNIQQVVDDLYAKIDDLPGELLVQDFGINMAFCISPANTKEEKNILDKLKKLIVHCGGTLDFNLYKAGPHLIKLSLTDAPFNTKDDLFKINFILDSIQLESLQDLNNYRANPSIYNNNLDVMDILCGTKTWQDAVPKDDFSDGGSISPFSDEEETPFISRIPNCSRRKPYSYQEEINLIEYILKKKLYKDIKGRAIWESIVVKNVVKDRTWQSLKEHYIKQIMPRIEQYKLKDKDKKRLLKGISGTSRDCRRQKVYSDSSDDTHSCVSDEASQGTVTDESQLSKEIPLDRSVLNYRKVPKNFAVEQWLDSSFANSERKANKNLRKWIKNSPGKVFDVASPKKHCVQTLAELAKSIIDSQTQKNAKDPPNPSEELANVPSTSLPSSNLQEGNLNPEELSQSQSLLPNAAHSCYELNDDKRPSPYMHQHSPITEEACDANLQKKSPQEERMQDCLIPDEIGCEHDSDTTIIFDESTHAKEQVSYNYSLKLLMSDWEDTDPILEQISNQELMELNKSPRIKAPSKVLSEIVLQEQRKIILADPPTQQCPGTIIPPGECFIHNISKENSEESPPQEHSISSSINVMQEISTAKEETSSIETDSSNQPGTVGEMDQKGAPEPQKFTLLSDDKPQSSSDECIPNSNSALEDVSALSNKVSSKIFMKRRKKTKIISSSSSSSSDIEENGNFCKNNADPSAGCSSITRNIESQQDKSLMSEPSKGKAKREIPTNEKDDIEKFLQDWNKSPVLHREPYSIKEDKALVYYIYKHQLIKHIKGNCIYKQMESSRFLKGRTWQSLKNRMLRIVLPNLRIYLSQGVPKYLVDEFESNIPKNPSKVLSAAGRKKAPYSFDEDDQILRYITQGDHYDEVLGTSLWKNMRQNVELLEHRTWHSLKERFKKQILKHLSTYSYQMTKSQMMKLKLATGQNIETDGDSDSDEFSKRNLPLRSCKMIKSKPAGDNKDTSPYPSVDIEETPSDLESVGSEYNASFSQTPVAQSRLKKINKKHSESILVHFDHLKARKDIHKTTLKRKLTNVENYYLEDSPPKKLVAPDSRNVRSLIINNQSKHDSPSMSSAGMTSKNKSSPQILSRDSTCLAYHGNSFEGNVSLDTLINPNSVFPQRLESSILSPLKSQSGPVHKKKPVSFHNLRSSERLSFLVSDKVNSSEVASSNKPSCSISDNNSIIYDRKSSRTNLRCLRLKEQKELNTRHKLHILIPEPRGYISHLGK